MGAKISLTPAEIALLETLGNAYAEFIKLPILHGSDADEFATSIHALQNIVLSRPTYRSMRRKAEKGT